MNLLYVQNEGVLKAIFVLFTPSISYSNPKQNNWDLGFSDLTSLFHYFFLHLGMILLKAKNF